MAKSNLPFKKYVVTGENSPFIIGIHGHLETHEFYNHCD